MEIATLAMLLFASATLMLPARAYRKATFHIFIFFNSPCFNSSRCHAFNVKSPNAASEIAFVMQKIIIQFHAKNSF